MPDESLYFDVRRDPDIIRFVFSSHMANIDAACDQATAFLRSACDGIDRHLFSVNLVIREGLVNAVRHGNAGDPEKKVRFELSLPDKNLIRIMIEDEGDGFDWRAGMDVLPPEDQDHGRGILIMKQYFTRYGYNEKGNILFLEKLLPA